MDVMSPSDPVEGFIMALPNSVLSRLHDPVAQSVGMALAGLVSFVFMGMSFVMPQAYAHVSVFHILIRAGLCVGLVVYVYRELFAKRRDDSSSSSSSPPTSVDKPHRRSISFAAAEPAVVSVPSRDDTEPTSPTSPAAAAVADSDRPQRLDDTTHLPEFVLRNSELSGADSAFKLVPVPKARRATNLIFDALNHRGMVEGAWVFVKRVAAAAKAIATASAAAAAPATVAAADGKSAAGEAGSGVSVEYPEVMGVYSLGDLMCGHPKIVHGGLTSALLDQTLGISAFVAQPEKSCFTANLNINYRKPLPANTAIAVRCRATKIEGRKLFATGRVELLNDPNTLFADATALFVSPK